MSLLFIIHQIGVDTEASRPESLPKETFRTNLSNIHRYWLRLVRNFFFFLSSRSSIIARFHWSRPSEESCVHLLIRFGLIRLGMQNGELLLFFPVKVFFLSFLSWNSFILFYFIFFNELKLFLLLTRFFVGRLFKSTCEKWNFNNCLCPNIQLLSWIVDRWSEHGRLFFVLMLLSLLFLLLPYLLSYFFYLLVTIT